MFDKIKLVFFNSIIYSLGNLSIALTGYVLIPVYTKHFALTEYGLLGILEVTYQIISTVFGFALYEAYNRWYFEKSSAGKQKSIFFTIFFFLFSVLVLINILLFNFSEELSVVLLDSAGYSYVFKLMAVSASLQILGRLPLTLMKLQQRAVFYATSNLVRLATVLLLTLYLIIVLNRGLEGIYEAQIFGHIAYFLLISGYLVKNVTIRLEIGILKEMWRYSYPLTFSAIIGIFLSVTDRYCLKFLSTFEEIGIYTLGFKISSGIKLLIVQSVQLAISPMIYEMMDEPGNRRFYSKLLTYFSFAIMIFVLGFSLFSREIIHVMARQESYYAAANFIPILSLGILFSMMRDTALTGINLSKRTKIIPVIGLGVAILNLTANLILIPLFGAMGSAVATLTSNILFFVFIYISAQRIYPIPYELRKIILIISVATGLYFFSEIFQHLHTIWRVGIKTVILCSFPVVLYFFGFYETVEIQSLKTILGKIGRRVQK